MKRYDYRRKAVATPRFAGFAIYRAKLGGHGTVDDGHIAVDREVASRKVVYWRAL